MEIEEGNQRTKKRKNSGLPKTQNTNNLNHFSETKIVPHLTDAWSETLNENEEKKRRLKEHGTFKSWTHFPVNFGINNSLVWE